MSVGKESILRAANAGAKKTEKAVKAAETVKPAETAEAVKTTARKKTVKKSVISAPNAEVLEAAFVTEDKKEPVNGPVHINEDLPVYLL